MTFPNVSDKLLSILLADDTSVFIVGSNIEDVIGILNAKLVKNLHYGLQQTLTLNI